ncbi:protein-L-isoaspartate(D-aspartate) O-methyltransferase [Hydrogenophaga sp. NFH-34]|nr:protein-L-isoaspartate(D-aspartate) O-methyltransferase [Hydrogenophaga sp. NFH-34]
MKRHTPPAPAPRPRPGFPARLPTAGSPAASSSGGQPRSALAGGPGRAAPGPAVASSPGGVGMDSQAVRSAMVRRLQAQGVSHPAVLAAMGAVERHRFVDTALAGQAYEDTSLPIGLAQTISKPSVVARMVELICQGRSERLGRVLEIGTGCGYQAAVLSHVSREVYTIERLRGLHEKARENLRPFRLSNVHLLFGDGMLGFAQGAPYAAIIAAAGGEDIPAAWVEQLAVGGRLVAPAHTVAGRQNLVVIDKTAAGVQHTVLEAVHFVPLKSGVA